MAVKTNFQEDTLARILSNYALGDLVRVEPISSGAVQTNYLLQTTQRKLIFRYYENRSLASVLFESHLLQYLKANNFPCPAPYPNKQGEYVSSYDEKPYILFEFIPGEHLENPGKAQKSQLIKTVAQLHILTRNYHPVNKQYRWNYNVALCRKLAQQAAHRINTANACAKLAWYNQELDNLRLPRSLPKGVCHCDFHFSNLLFQDGKLIALLDYDDANYTYLAFDVAGLLNPFYPTFEWNTWMQFPKDADVFDFREARDVVAEYDTYRPMSSVEKKHLFDMVKLHVMLDCIWYFERGDVNDFFEKRKIDALNRLGREKFTQTLFGSA